MYVASSIDGVHLESIYSLFFSFCLNLALSLALTSLYSYHRPTWSYFINVKTSILRRKNFPSVCGVLSQLFFVFSQNFIISYIATVRISFFFLSSFSDYKFSSMFWISLGYSWRPLASIENFHWNKNESARYESLIFFILHEIFKWFISLMTNFLIKFHHAVNFCYANKFYCTRMTPTILSNSIGKKWQNELYESAWNNLSMNPFHSSELLGDFNEWQTHAFTHANSTNIWTYWCNSLYILIIILIEILCEDARIWCWPIAKS